jgi:hypothetical protein
MPPLLKNAATAPLVYFDNVPVFGITPAIWRSSSPPGC